MAMNFERFTKTISNLNTARHLKGLDLDEHKQVIDNFIGEFGLLDFRDFKIVASSRASSLTLYKEVLIDPENRL